MFKNWFVHNVFAHPAMQLLQMIGLGKLGNKIHDYTLPKDH